MSNCPSCDRPLKAKNTCVCGWMQIDNVPVPVDLEAHCYFRTDKQCLGPVKFRINPTTWACEWHYANGYDKPLRDNAPRVVIRTPEEVRIADQALNALKRIVRSKNREVA